MQRLLSARGGNNLLNASDKEKQPKHPRLDLIQLVSNVRGMRKQQETRRKAFSHGLFVFVAYVCVCVKTLIPRDSLKMSKTRKNNKKNSNEDV